MKIAEIFRSVQGEGRLTGVDSTFVRTSGCNLRCWFCDTPYTSWSPEGEDLSVDEIVDHVDSLDSSHVVLTGGEPMLYAELVPLAERLRRQGRHITIETAGTLYLPVACDLMSVSPKLAGSAPDKKGYTRWHRRHERTRHAPGVIRRLVREYDYQFKFVVDSVDDCHAVEHYVAEFPDINRQNVMLMPQGMELDELEEKAAWLMPYCEQNQLTFCPRRQIEWFGLVRGT